MPTNASGWLYNSGSGTLSYTTPTAAQVGAEPTLGFTPINKAGDSGIGALNISNTTASTSPGTGALVVSGGVGIAGDAFLGGKMNLTAKTSSASAGDIWQDSTQQTISTFVSGLQEQLIGVIWSKTVTTTLVSWTTAATILGAADTGVGTLTIPANCLVAGKTVRIRLKGVLGSNATTAPTFNVAVSLGGVSLGATAATSLTTLNMVNRAWSLEFELTCRTTGTTGTVISDGIFTISNNATVAYCWPVGLALTEATIDTTVDNSINVTVACNTASTTNKISCTVGTIEILN